MPTFVLKTFISHLMLIEKIKRNYFVSHPSRLML